MDRENCNMVGSEEHARDAPISDADRKEESAPGTKINSIAIGNVEELGYPENCFPGGSYESFGSDRVPQRSLFHHRR